VKLYPGVTVESIEVLAKLEGLNPEALLLEPRSVYDTALVDVTDDPQDQWIREGKTWVAVYDMPACVEAIIGWLGCPEDEALEWFYTNTSGAWIGAGTPTFRYPEANND